MIDKIKDEFKSAIIRIGSLLLMSLVSFSAGAQKPLVVVTTLLDLAEIVKTIGGDQVEVSSLLTGKEDPHYVDASPSFIRDVARADIVCVMGLDLEVGWMPKVLAKSGNKKVQPGGLGTCEAATEVQAVDIPQGVLNRSMGDIHPGGNPHFNLSPSALKEAANSIYKVLKANRPEASLQFEKGLKVFHQQMDSLLERNKTKIQVYLKTARSGPLALEYHKEFVYFFKDYGISSMGSIEEKPGVPPSAGRLAFVSTEAKGKGVKVALAAVSHPDRQLKRFSELSGIPVLKLPTSVQKNEGPKTISDLQDHIVKLILNELNRPLDKAI